MKNLFILLIVALGAMLTSCTTRQLSLANQSMQVYENYESQARIWKSRNPHKRSLTGAQILKYGSIVYKIEWDNALLVSENGYVSLYKKSKNNWMLVKKFHPRKPESYPAFVGITRYGNDDVRVVVSSGRIDVYMAGESHQMR